MTIWAALRKVRQVANTAVGFIVQRASSSASGALQQWQSETGDTLLQVEFDGMLGFTARTDGNVQWEFIGSTQSGSPNTGWHHTIYNPAGGFHWISYYNDLQLCAVHPGSINVYNSLSDVKFAGRQTSAGTPTSQTWSANDLFIDSKGVWQLCTAGGSPGTWAAGGWQLAGFWKAGSALQTSGAITVAAFDELMIVARIVSLSATDVPALRFNGDAGNSYSYNGLTTTSAISSTGPTITSWGANTTSMAKLSGNSASGPRTITCVISNRSGTSKVGSITSALGSGLVGTNSVKDIMAQLEWVNTSAQITSVTMLTAGGTATMAAESGFQVFGRDLA